MVKNLVLLASALICWNVSAQVTPVKAPPTLSSPSPSPAVTAEQKVAIAEMLESMNFKQMMSQMGAAMAQSIPQMTEKMSEPMLAELSPKEKAKMRAQTTKSAQARLQKMMAIYSEPAIISGMEDIMARLYLKRFSLDEIKAITVFYKSDAGKKLLSSTPQIMQESMPEMMGLLMPRINEIAKSIEKEAKENLEAEQATTNAKVDTGKAPAKKAEPAKK